MKIQKKSARSQIVKKEGYRKTHPGTKASHPVSGEKWRTTILKDPGTAYSVSGKLRDIGNSKGVILNSRIIEEAGITADADLIIHASDGLIIIEAKYSGNVNTNLSTWDSQFKKAIKKSSLPDGDLWKGLENKFDQGEWI